MFNPIVVCLSFIVTFTYNSKFKHTFLCNLCDIILNKVPKSIFNMLSLITWDILCADLCWQSDNVASLSRGIC